MASASGLEAEIKALIVHPFRAWLGSWPIRTRGRPSARSPSAREAPVITLSRWLAADLSVARSERTLEVRVRIPWDLASLGHFPGAPIVAGVGVAQLHFAMRALEKLLVGRLEPRR